eukprot:4738820-Karenia_brevis.AAC.1
MADPELCSEYEKWMAAYKCNNVTDMDTHLEELCEHAREGAWIFNADARRPKKPWLSNSTWTLMQRK